MRIPLELKPADAQPFDVVGFGQNSVDLLTVVDLFPRPDSKMRARRFSVQPGGQVATAMVTCQKLGWRSRYIGLFGDDEYGRIGRASLSSEGVDVAAARVLPNVSSQFAVIIVPEPSGERTVIWDTHPELRWDPGQVPRDAIQAGRVLLVDGDQPRASAQAARFAREAGMRTVIDIEQVGDGVDELLPEIDVIVASQGFPSQFTGVAETGAALAALAREFQASIVCVTLGREGSLTLCGGREIRMHGFQVPAVDTTGAGDVFRGAFIAGWLKGGAQAELEDVLEYASAVAAMKCTQLGARTGIPTAAEAENLLKTSPEHSADS